MREVAKMVLYRAYQASNERQGHKRLKTRASQQADVTGKWAFDGCHPMTSKKESIILKSIIRLQQQFIVFREKNVLVFV